MGCFSFICQVCGRGIKSSSFSGEQCHLFLLKNGSVIQKMSGEYDSYGRVFIDNTQVESVKHDLRESIHWGDPFPEKEFDDRENSMISDGDDHWKWSRVCDLMHGRTDDTNGIAAFHKSCYSGQTPEVQSEHDPNQGWGSEDEDDNYFTTTTDDCEYPLPKPIIGYDVKKSLRLGFLRDNIGEIGRNIKNTKMTVDLFKARLIVNKDLSEPVSGHYLEDIIEMEQEKIDKLENELVLFKAEFEKLKDDK